VRQRAASVQQGPGDSGTELRVGYACGEHLECSQGGPSPLPGGLLDGDAADPPADIRQDGTGVLIRVLQPLPDSGVEQRQQTRVAFMGPTQGQP